MFMVDMAHFAGLVAAGLFPSPLPHAHVVTTTTHKTLRGPRGGMMLTNDPEIAKKINSALFPGLQGGPLMHVIAAKAAAFGEALSPEFRAYQQAVADNAQGAGRDAGRAGAGDRHRRHRQPPDAGRSPPQARHRQGRRGQPRPRPYHRQQERHPVRPRKAGDHLGLRLGTPAATTRGFGAAEFREVGRMIGEVLEALSLSNDGTNAAVERAVGERVLALCARFPIYRRQGA